MPSSTSLAITLAALSALGISPVNALVALYGQCGGANWTGETACVAGAYCMKYSDFYSQCIPGTSSTSSSSTKSTTATTTTKASSTTTSTSATSTATLRGLNKLAKAKGRYFGTALDQLWTNTDTPYLALSGNADEFGAMTCGNAQKWAYIEATQNTFSYTNADYMVNWSKTRGQIVRGHTFVWHSQLASWVTSGNFDSAALTAVIQNHIQNVATHYKGQLYAWDVVNEAFNDDGTWRTSVFYNTLGTSYISIALKAARAADPSAKLYINDYNVEGVNSKSTALYNHAVLLQSQGVPLDGVGLQAHLIVGSVPTDIQTNIQRFANIKLDVAITELDIRMTTPSDSTKLAQQATDYAAVTKACVAVARCVGITTWDTSDDYSWIPSVFSGQGEALLFDANNQPKPAYYAVANALAAATVSGPL